MPTFLEETFFEASFDHAFETDFVEALAGEALAFVSSPIIAKQSSKVKSVASFQALGIL